MKIFEEKTMKPLGNLNLLKIEEDILEWWEKQKIYEKIKAQEPADEEKLLDLLMAHHILQVMSI